MRLRIFQRFGGLALAALLSACATSSSGQTTPPPASPPTSVLRASDVQWQALNPARGDASPKAATLWGDRNGAAQTGFLVKFVPGFQSPPHIHNVSYRGVVIRGLVHNADPQATQLWMSTGSFWTQPKGGVHITAAKDTETVAFIEIDAGPYLVRPVDKAFATPEKPVNVDASNIVWVAPTRGASTLKVAYLWGTPDGPGPSGRLYKLAAGSSATLSFAGAPFRAVVIAGRVVVTGNEAKLAPGSFFTGDKPVVMSCPGASECLVYVRHGSPE